MKNVIKILILLVSNLLYAQLDNIHYLQPKIMYEYTDSSIEQDLIIVSTPSTEEIEVEITSMSGNKIPALYVQYYSTTGTYLGGDWDETGIIKISSTKYAQIVNSYNSSADVSGGRGNSYTTRPLNESYIPISGDKAGLILKSNKDFYANYRIYTAGHAVSYLTKGSRAVGKKFHWGGTPARHRATNSNINNFVTITALEEGITTVDIGSLDIGITFIKESTTETPNTEKITLELEKGQSRIIRVGLYNYTNADKNLLQRNGWLGASISSNKNIVVTNGGLAAQGGASGNADYGVEQITPLDYLGTDHFILQGLGSTADEKVYIIGTQSETEVKVNGTFLQKIGIGEWLEIPGTNFSNLSMRVTTDKPAYVFLKNFGNTADNTNNLVQVPPIGCNGKTDLIIPDASAIYDNNFSTTHLLMLARKNENNTTPEVYINGTLRTAATTDSSFPSSDGKWQAYKMRIGNSTNNKKNIRIVYDGAVQIQLLGASGNAGYGGYYNGFTKPSDFKIDIVTPRFSKACTYGTGDTLLKPILGTYSGKYTWYKNDKVINGANSATYRLTENDMDPAEYKIEVLVSDGCTYASEIIQTEVCPCVKQPNTNPGTLYPGIVGVSTTDNTDKSWPNNVNNAFLTLKSNDKGLVITRNANPETTIAEPVEGMIVYDTDDNCYKLFDGTIWKCLRKKCYDYDN